MVQCHKQCLFSLFLTCVFLFMSMLICWHLIHCCRCIIQFCCFVWCLLFPCIMTILNCKYIPQIVHLFSLFVVLSIVIILTYLDTAAGVCFDWCYVSLVRSASQLVLCRCVYSPTTGLRVVITVFHFHLLNNSLSYYYRLRFLAAFMLWLTSTGAFRVWMNINTLCPKKRTPFYFSNNSVKKLTDFNDFWCVKSWENFTSIACTFACGRGRFLGTQCIMVYFKLFGITTKSWINTMNSKQ